MIDGNNYNDNFMAILLIYKECRIKVSPHRCASCQCIVYEQCVACLALRMRAHVDPPQELHYISAMQHVSHDATNQWETTHCATMSLFQMNLKQMHGCMHHHYCHTLINLYSVSTAIFPHNGKIFNLLIVTNSIFLHYYSFSITTAASNFLVIRWETSDNQLPMHDTLFTVVANNIAAT